MGNLFPRWGSDPSSMYLASCTTYHVLSRGTGGRWSDRAKAAYKSRRDYIIAVKGKMRQRVTERVGGVSANLVDFVEWRLLVWLTVSRVHSARLGDVRRHYPMFSDVRRYSATLSDVQRCSPIFGDIIRASIHNRDTHALITLTKLIWCSNGTHHTHTVLSGALTVLSKDHLVLREMGVSIEECSHEWPSVS